jgi:hypothetical protein
VRRFVCASQWSTPTFARVLVILGIATPGVLLFNGRLRLNNDVFIFILHQKQITKRYFVQTKNYLRIDYAKV